MEALLVILFLGVFAVLAVFGAMGLRKRREAMQALAKSKGLRFDESRVSGFDQQFPAFKCLARGSNRYAYNRMTGRWGERDFIGFDYHYETHTTDSKGRRQTHHHHFSAVILGSPVPLQPLTLRPEGFFDKVTEFFGADDIDFESAEFSKRFHVTSPDRKWAFDVIHARTMQFLLDSPTFTIQFDRHTVIAYRGGRLSAEEFTAAADTLAGVLDRLPEYLVRQQTGQG